jgi:hypothetical protein
VGIGRYSGLSIKGFVEKFEGNNQIKKIELIIDTI